MKLGFAQNVINMKKETIINGGIERKLTIFYLLI